MKIRLCKLVTMVLLFCCSFSGGKTLNLIRGTYHAWWVILNLPKDSVNRMVADFSNGGEVVLTTVPWSHYPNNQHPVIFEIGKEMNCGPIDIPLLQSDFMEFKFEIPFTQISGKHSGPLNFKAKLYENSKVNAKSSDIFYGLDAEDANMSMTNDSYVIDFSGHRFHANFTSSKNRTWGDVQEYPEFNVFESAMNIPWFGSHGLKSSKPCSSHFYDFKTAKLRPVSSTLTFDPAILNSNFPQYKYQTLGMDIDQPFGSVEILVNFTMNLPNTCQH